MTPDEKRVLELDLQNLTQADIDWLHVLKGKAQRIENGMFIKSLGIESLEKKS